MLPRTTFCRDAILALCLAAALGVAWTARDWANLAALRLPDTDDVMRLQQVRDWLGGQAWSDLAQHRLGGGVAMHWSRLADLGPAALIAGAAPLAGRHAAEVAAVIAWPLALFAAAILLVGRIARAVGAPAGTAMVLAAIAYPATTVFAPGRIDHHGLQMVLLLAATLAMLRPPSLGTGVATGLFAAAGLTIGLETSPLLGVLGLGAVAEWIAGGRGARLRGLGIGAGGGIVVARLAFAPAVWSVATCDAWAAPLWHAALPLAAVPLALGLGGPFFSTRRQRVAAAAVAGGTAATIALWLSPTCLHPYGGIDPILARLWLARVGEAQPLFSATPDVAIGYAGLMVAGLAATLWRAARTRSRGWALLAALLAGALAVTVVQLRGAYPGALLAAPGLAAAINAARARGTLSLATAWAGSAGMLYPIAAEALVPAPAGPASTGGACTSPALARALAALPPGETMAPIDAGAWLIATTPQRLVGAPYHRNNAGNLAVVGFYAGSPAAAARIASDWRLAYVVVCADMPDHAVPGTAAHSLAARPLPGWRTIARLPDGARIDVNHRLSVRPAAR